MISEVSPVPQMYVLNSIVMMSHSSFFFLGSSSSHCSQWCVNQLTSANLVAYYYTFQVGKTSAFIGPLVSSAIIDAADGNANMPFAFLFALSVHHSFHSNMVLHLFRGVLSCGVLYFVDVKKSRIECEDFVTAEGKRDAFASSE